MKHDENQVARVKDVREIVKEVVLDAEETILQGITIILKDYATKDDLNKMEVRLDTKIEKVSSDLESVKSDVSDIRRRVIDLEADTITSNLPAIALRRQVQAGEFNDFKAKFKKN